MPTTVNLTKEERAQWQEALVEVLGEIREEDIKLSVCSLVETPVGDEVHLDGCILLAGYDKVVFTAVFNVSSKKT